MIKFLYGTLLIIILFFTVDKLLHVERELIKCDDSIVIKIHLLDGIFPVFLVSLIPQLSSTLNAACNESIGNLLGCDLAIPILINLVKCKFQVLIIEQSKFIDSCTYKLLKTDFAVTIGINVRKRRLSHLTYIH